MPGGRSKGSTNAFNHKSGSARLMAGQPEYQRTRESKNRKANLGNSLEHHPCSSSPVMQQHTA